MTVSSASLLGGIPPSVFARTDYWRRSQACVDGEPGHKEWSHFCAFTPQLSTVVNFSLMEQTRSSDRRVSEIPRVVIMVNRSDGIWDGDIAQFPVGSAHTGERRTDLIIGDNSLQFADGAYHIDASADSGSIAARLRFYPLARPAIASSVRLSANERMRWLVVPRLAAEGQICVAGKSYTLGNAPAYHDRNWGHFCWGGDYSWEWATILPTSLSIPWSLVYMRISDGSQSRTYSQALMVWRGDRSARVFHGTDMYVKQIGSLSQRRTLRLPRVVDLMVPGEACSIPRSMEIEANAWSDYINMRLALDGYAQVGVPNDGPKGLTMLSEVPGGAEVSGRIGGEDVEFRGRLMAEFKHAAH
jgi:hypothetical protein